MSGVLWGDRLRLLRMPWALLSYVRAPRCADPAAEVRVQLERRAERFLDTVRRTVFAAPEHPYRRMFEFAGCTYQDLASSVQRDGLESALAAIRRAGVFLSHDEFKGRAPIVRSGRHIAATAASWNNPLVFGGLLGMSSGSSGESVRTTESIAFLRYQETHLDLLWREFGLGRRAHAETRTTLPSLRAFELGLGAARLGYRIDRWFAAGRPARHAAHYAGATRLMVGIARLAGATMPYPEMLPPDDFRPVAAWIAGQRARGVSCAVTGMVSPAARVAAAALDHGLDIGGTIFSAGGEALTAAKRAVIESAGAEVYPRYHATEIGDIGHACRRMRTGNAVHLYRDALAVIAHRQPAALAGVDVDALLFSTLLPSSPRILINVEIGDAGMVTERRCDCGFAQAGMTTVIDDIASYGKLTGHGVTLVGTDMVSVLEQRLPALLGGRAGDFQLVERDAGTQTEIVLYVSPRVPTSAAAARHCLLGELRRHSGGSVAAGLWADARAIDAVIAEPIAGPTGKVLPLHLLGRRRTS